MELTEFSTSARSLRFRDRFCLQVVSPCLAGLWLLSLGCGGGGDAQGQANPVAGPTTVSVIRTSLNANEQTTSQGSTLIAGFVEVSGARPPASLTVRQETEAGTFTTIIPVLSDGTWGVDLDLVSGENAIAIGAPQADY